MGDVSHITRQNAVDPDVLRRDCLPHICQARCIDRAAADIADAPLRDRLAKITARGRDILTRIEQDPSDLRRARKFLKVYLDGALEATRKYARSQHDLGDSDMYLKFRSLLDDMQATFDQQHEKLLTNDRIDLDVEIDVLAERLNRETVLQ